MIHKSVLLNEVREFFHDIKGVFVDATLGLGGHSYAILEDNPKIELIGIDKDIESLNFAKERLEKFKGRFSLMQGSFATNIAKILKEHSNIAGILADIGVSSPQLDNLKRGFSFESEALDMRMDLDSSISARDIINSYSKDELNKIFREFGEIANYEKITRAILESRKNKKITSAKELSKIVESSSKVRGSIHPATLVFQALRIEVNNELGELREFLGHLESLKKTKVAIISFHSLEDRIVKDTFKLWAKECICDSSVMKCECGGRNAKGKIVNKKPIIPTNDEISQNKRSRSAKMRCFIFNG